MKNSELINYGKNLLKENDIEDYSIIAKELACFIFGLDRNELIVNMDKEVDEKDKARYYLALIEIVQGMPVQYITNKQEFMGFDFYVDENVLIQAAQRCGTPCLCYEKKEIDYWRKVLINALPKQSNLI